MTAHAILTRHTIAYAIITRHRALLPVVCVRGAVRMWRVTLQSPTPAREVEWSRPRTVHVVTCMRVQITPLGSSP